MAEKIVQTAGRDALGEFAPEFAHYNDDVLFGENWNAGGIDAKQRSIVTVVALMSQGITDSSLKYHLQNAKSHGVSQSEIAAIITHAAFYAGWPKAWAVFTLAKEVWSVGELGAGATDEAAPAGGEAGGQTDGQTGPQRGSEGPLASSADNTTREAHEASMVFPVGAPNDAYAQYFVGQSYLAPVSTEQVGVFNVTFEPACRNNWHIHHASKGGGQILVCVAGRGYYQEEGKPAQELKPGDCVNIPAGVKHWHGAAPTSWFSHLAIEVPGEDAFSEWCEPVSNEDYGKLS